MKIIHFIKCWLLTLILSAFGVWVVSGDPIVGLFYVFFAGITSIPFIILMMVMALYWSDKKVSKKEFHRNIALTHLTLSILTWLCIALFGGLGEWETTQITWVILACFVIDSLLIHYNINKHYGKNFEEYKETNPELLDDL